MSEKELIKRIKKLPREARKEAADFVEYLSEKYLQESEIADSTEKSSILESSFRGIWKGREDFQDSTKWVRDLRKNRLAE